MLKRFAPALLTIGVTVSATAQQEAHVHGVGAINLAVEKDEVTIEFNIPSESLVGFEWKPKTDAERKAVKDAIALLRDPANVVELPASAKCHVHDVEAEWEASDSDDHGDHDHGHDDHAKHDEHDHDEHEHDDHAKHDDHGHDDHGHDDHAKHDDHGHDDHDHDKAAHSEFHAHYHFECDGDAVETLQLTLFKTWSRIETIRLQALNENGQTGGNFTASNATIKLP